MYYMGIKGIVKWAAGWVMGIGDMGFSEMGLARNKYAMGIGWVINS
jgi:hypothetical protein